MTILIVKYPYLNYGSLEPSGRYFTKLSILSSVVKLPANQKIFLFII